MAGPGSDNPNYPSKARESAVNWQYARRPLASIGVLRVPHPHPHPEHLPLPNL